MLPGIREPGGIRAKIVTVDIACGCKLTAIRAAISGAVGTAVKVTGHQAKRDALLIIAPGCKVAAKLKLGVIAVHVDIAIYSRCVRFSAFHSRPDASFGRAVLAPFTIEQRLHLQATRQPLVAQISAYIGAILWI